MPLGNISINIGGTTRQENTLGVPPEVVTELVRQQADHTALQRKVLPLSAAVAVPIIADAIALKAFAAMERLGVRSEREGDASFSCSLPAAWPEGAGRHQ